MSALRWGRLTSHHLWEGNKSASFLGVCQFLWSIRGDLRQTDRFWMRRLDDDLAAVRKALDLAPDEVTLAAATADPTPAAGGCRPRCWTDSRPTARPCPWQGQRLWSGPHMAGRSRVGVAAWVAAGIAVAVPIALDPGGYFIFLPLKLLFATVLVAVGIAALVLERRQFPAFGPVVAWLALLAVLVAAAIVGVGGLTSWIGYPGRGLGVVAWGTFFGAFVLGSSLTGPGERRRVASAAVGAAIVVSAYALLQEWGDDPLEWTDAVDVTRTRSTLGNAAFLGAYLAMVVPLAARLALEPSESMRARAIHGASAVLGSIALLTTETRGAWLATIAAGVVIVVLDRRRLRAVPNRRLLLIGGAALFAVAALATVSPYGARLRSIVDPETATGRGRVTQWERTLELVADRPVLGWGPDTYALVFPSYIDAEFERTIGREVIPDRAHNMFLDMAAWTGVLGVLAYAAVLSAVGWAATRVDSRDAITVGLAGGCVAYVVQLQFSIHLADLDTVFWLLAGLLVAPAAVRRVVIPRGYAAVPAAAALALVVWGGTDVAADRVLRTALEAEADGDLAQAGQDVDRAADIAFGRALYLQGAGRMHTRIGGISGEATEFARALHAVDEALDLVPRDLELAMDRADTLLSWGEVTADVTLIERGAAAYEDVVARDPYSSRAHLRLGVAYVELGREDAAELEWQTAAGLAPRATGPLLNLGILYEQQGRDREARQALLAVLAIDSDNRQAQEALRRMGS